MRPDFLEASDLVRKRIQDHGKLTLFLMLLNHNGDVVRLLLGPFN